MESDNEELFDLNKSTDTRFHFILPNAQLINIPVNDQKSISMKEIVLEASADLPRTPVFEMGFKTKNTSYEKIESSSKVQLARELSKNYEIKYTESKTNICNGSLFRASTSENQITNYIDIIHSEKIVNMKNSDRSLSDSFQQIEPDELHLLLYSHLAANIPINSKRSTTAKDKASRPVINLNVSKASLEGTLSKCELQPKIARSSITVISLDTPIYITNVIGPENSKQSLNSSVRNVKLEDTPSKHQLQLGYRSISKNQLQDMSFSTSNECDENNLSLVVKDSNVIQESNNSTLPNIPTWMVNNLNTNSRNIIKPNQSITTNVVTIKPVEERQASNERIAKRDKTFDNVSFRGVSSKRQLQLDWQQNSTVLRMEHPSFNINSYSIKRTISNDLSLSVASRFKEESSIDTIQNSNGTPSVKIPSSFPLTDERKSHPCDISNVISQNSRERSKNSIHSSLEVNTSPKRTVKKKLSSENVNTVIHPINNNLKLIKKLSAEKRDEISHKDMKPKVSTPLSENLSSSESSDILRSPNIVQKRCYKCSKLIGDRYICALGKMWHVEHFTCFECSNKLTNGMFYENMGELYCKDDYINKFHPKCAKCQKSIHDKYVCALNNTWHVEHFNCEFCGAILGVDGYFEMAGKPYCTRDYSKLFAPKCHACKSGIMDICLSALNHLWHPKCFICKDCKTPISGDTFFQLHGKAVCPSCSDNTNIKL